MKESVRPSTLLKESVRPRRSTAMLMAAWVGTLVLYLFVKPDAVPSRPEPLNTVPAAVNPAVAPPR
ncbi:hypothetical protein [Nocardia brasiliensis]|uniref:hypothetical protein n=1 Tax=Nocardia brasiliensis TaxID=37326 RepID=UPI001EEB76F2|nr:hypothetical protein [Nocardia brasiliensis]